jgi:hypothetical protein
MLHEYLEDGVEAGRGYISLSCGLSLKMEAGG